MNPNIHKLSGRFCPFCLRALWLVRETGFEFCPGNPECDYEATPERDDPPLSHREKLQRQIDKTRGEIESLQKRMAGLVAECAELERELNHV